MKQLEPQKLKQSAVCLWGNSKGQNKPKGAGVLISDQYILTCAHVVKECLVAEENKSKNPLQETVNITFPFSKESANYKAKVIFYEESSNQRGDVAGLQLLAPKPEDTKPTMLYVTAEFWGKEFRIFGFPQPYDEGVWASGEFRDEAANAWIQVEDKQQGRGIRQGFSGSGVWHSELGCIVGIMSAATTTGKTAFLIPTHILNKVWNKVAISKESLFKSPESNLPSLPKGDLPKQPFRDLEHFGEAHSEIFFGRNKVIVELYQHLTNPESTPITLLYGQAGVGKSSFLAAGLLPRLKTGDVQGFLSYKVLYVRRNQEWGSLGSLLKALKADVSAEINLKASWQCIEKEADKPLIIVLDQLEEIYTNPLNDSQQEVTTQTWGQEITELKQALEQVFSQREDRPRGRLILSFRKEWLAEIEKELSQSDLPSAKKFFLEPLDYEGVIEIVEGVTHNERLQSHYSLTVEDGVAEIIARDLLRDVGSSLAPTLQVLLTKMWNKAKEISRSKPVLSLALYEKLRAQGILLDDFLDERLRAIEKWQKDVVDLGLVLDILEYHTTFMVTATHHLAQEIKKRYEHYPHLSELISKLKEHYLLTDLSKEDTNERGHTRLTHDILAPLVRKRFTNSNKLGQRARRILESRLVNEPIPQRRSNFPTLDKSDVTLVRNGKLGMRKWTELEEKLVKDSLKQVQKSEFIRSIIIGSIFVGVLYTLFRYLTLKLIGSDPRDALDYFFWGILLGTSVAFSKIAGIFFEKGVSKTILKLVVGAGGFTLVTIIMSLTISSTTFLRNPLPAVLGSLLVGLGISNAIGHKSHHKKILYVLLAILLAAIVQWCLHNMFNFSDGLIFAWSEQIYAIGDFSYLTYLSLIDVSLVVLIIIGGLSLKDIKQF